MSAEIINLTPSLYEYLLNVSLREPEVLQQLRAKTQTLTGAIMQISPEQGQFMQLLVKILGAKKTLDIGTFTGYSALAVALALPDDAKIISCELSTEHINLTKEFWKDAGVEDKIDLRVGPAVATLQQLIDNGESGTYDFAFIDADKNNYDNYYELSLKLLRKGGLVAVDNVLWDGAVADANNQEKATQSIRTLNTKLHTDERVDISLLPVGDGLTLARKR